MSAQTAARTAAAVLFLSVSFSLSALPPGETLSALEKAVRVLESSDVPATYLMTTRFTIANGGGKTLQTIDIQERVTLRPGEKAVRETLSRTTTGEDVDAASAATERSGKSGSSGASWQLVLPAGKDLDLYTFGATIPDGTLSYADFAPAPGTRSKDGMVKGRLTWNSFTGAPEKLEAVPVKNPPFTSSLMFSFNFSGSRGFIYPETVLFTGEGGFLFLRRKFHSVSAITDFRRED